MPSHHLFMDEMHSGLHCRLDHWLDLVSCTSVSTTTNNQYKGDLYGSKLLQHIEFFVVTCWKKISRFQTNSVEIWLRYVETWKKLVLRVVFQCNLCAQLFLTTKIQWFKDFRKSDLFYVYKIVRFQFSTSYPNSHDLLKFYSFSEFWITSNIFVACP